MVSHLPLRNHWYGTLTVLTLVVAPLGFFMGSSLLPDNSPPHLKLPVHPYNVGSGKPGEVVRGFIKVANSGGSPLEFELTPGCGCTELSPSKGVVGPRSVLSVQVGVRLENTWGAHRHVSVLVETNDPGRREERFNIVAECPEPFRISPSQVNFGTCLLNRAKSVEVHLHPVEGRSFRPGDEPTWTVESPAFAAERIESAFEGLALRVTVASHAEPTQLQSRIAFRNSVGETIFVPLRAEFVNEITAAPRVIWRPAEGRSTQRLLVWRSNDEPLDGPVNIQFSDQRTHVQEVTPPGQKRRMFEVTVEADLTGSAKPDPIQMTFAQSDSPVMVTVKSRLKSRSQEEGEDHGAISP